MRSVFRATTLRPSFASNRTRYEPGFLGTPERTPSLRSNRTPFGSLPLATRHVLGAMPPDVFSLARYLRPSFPDLSAAVVTASLAATA